MDGEFYFKASVYGQAKGNYEGSRSPSPYGCGEDSFFICRDQGKIYTVGIADGVGGWKDYNYNPAIISRKLMMHANQNCSHTQHPRELMELAYNKIKEDSEIKGGGTTCCILTLEPSGTLKSANIGDSGYIIIRDHSIIAKSELGRTPGGSPHQLSIIPLALQGVGIINTPLSDSELLEHQICPGDIIILATDGLWDNIQNLNELLFLTTKYSIENLAHGVAKHALSYYIKPDDITVIALKVSRV